MKYTGDRLLFLNRKDAAKRLPKRLHYRYKDKHKTYQGEGYEGIEEPKVRVVIIKSHVGEPLDKRGRCSEGDICTAEDVKITALYIVAEDNDGRNDERYYCRQGQSEGEEPIAAAAKSQGTKIAGW